MGTSAKPSFDRGIWGELIELFGHEGVTEMLGALQRDLPLQQQQLGAAIAAEDRGSLKRTAHSLRGVALQFGAESLAQRCGDIEQSVAGSTPTAQIGLDATRMLETYAALLRHLQDALHDA